MEKKPLIILTGPTAVGKTSLSIQLAKALGGEIISADSMQVYRGMDIGTAKIRPEEMDGVRHHLIDILEPTVPFDVATFQKLAKEAMEGIYQRGHVPLLVGGTGFYIQSVLYDIDFLEADKNLSYRSELETLGKERGASYLHEMLKAVDVASAAAIHANNVKRVIRALEYFKQTGEPISLHNEREKKRISPYAFRYYVLHLPRAMLYERINERVEKMRQEGLTEEVQRLLSQGCTKEMVSMQGLGYKEIISALEGEESMDVAYEQLKQNTRHFAKRQLTWFRREKDTTWLEKTEFSTENALLEFCIQDCQKMFAKERTET